MFATLLSIWFVHLVAVVSPGPNALLISQIAAAHRGRSAAFAVLGVTVGAFFWSTSAILGMHLVFQLFPGLRMALQLAGGSYLLYSAWRMWRAESAMQVANAVLVLSGASAFRKGLLTNVTNPKSALFFGSIFAAVFPPSPGLPLQCLTVIVVMTNAFCWYGGLAYLFSRGRVRLAYARARATINRVAAGLFGALGLGLLLATLREIFSRSVQVTN